MASLGLVPCGIIIPQVVPAVNRGEVAVEEDTGIKRVVHSPARNRLIQVKIILATTSSGHSPTSSRSSRGRRRRAAGATLLYVEPDRLPSEQHVLRDGRFLLRRPAAKASETRDDAVAGRPRVLAQQSSASFLAA